LFASAANVEFPDAVTVESLSFACELAGFESLVGNSLVGGFDRRDRRYLQSSLPAPRRELMAFVIVKGGPSGR
jgi:hypothetical protein